jgi:hypothetical protein
MEELRRRLRDSILREELLKPGNAMGKAEKSKLSKS